VTKRIAIIQSNYIPWRGYFDMIGMSDEFVLLDNVQYTKNDWRNRNRIPNGREGIWLTIPVRTADARSQRIDQAAVSDPRWARKHWNTISQAYARAPHFKRYETAVAAMYERATSEKLLTGVNRIFIEGICALLGIQTVLSYAQPVDTEDPTERVVRLCQSRAATHYLTGPSARNYVKAELFERANIELEYMDYSAYRPYRQLQAPFDPAVTVLDLLFNEGTAAPQFMAFASGVELDR